ncbi:hypothetical protein GJ744_004914 [Endocarpon pusillum]|uniref:NB-ARC domain-containing protein n=1 Tax=Endocarpon pusillum TaxID=364733 RepID=A0A8H7AND7_9EURO|nr:hypothetical protein GJ744_004914 [Endocarpon pusillum]
MAFPFHRSRANARTSSPGVEDEDQNSDVENYLRELKNPPAPTIDIVAIHGLNPIPGKANHGEGTWSKNGVLWLKDERFLPGRFPNARILLFGYNSRVAPSTSNAGVMDIAKALLNRLGVKRRDDPQRPIVFLCHSLGGIIVKQALVRAMHSTAYRSIHWSTRAIAFFGTPHRGGNHADLGRVLASIAGFLTGSVKNNFLETLQKNSSGAADIHELFMEQAQEYRIVSFYETLPKPGLGLIVDKVSATLGLPECTEISVPVAANHSDICKFDRSDPTYELVIENIADLVQYALQPRQIGTPLLAPTISLTDPENWQRTLSVESLQSTGSFDLSDSTGSSSRSGGQYGMPTFQDIESGNSHPKKATDSTPTSPVFILPYSSNPDFIGRDKIFNIVKHSLGSTTSGQRRVALYGPGGVGKSQIAVRYAYWYRQNFPDHSIFWIHCGTAERFRQGLIDIGTECHVAGIADRNNNRLLLLKDWLQRKIDFKWLMILDNADDSSQLWVDLSSYIPDCEHGSILITTRDSKLGRRLVNGRSLLQIQKMSPEEAVMMLKTRLSTKGETSPITPVTPAPYQQPVSDNDLLRLAQSLDYMPLAIVQAAGFITDNAISVGRYVVLFGDDASAVKLLMHNVQEWGRDSDVPSSVYATWKLSIEQIQKAYPKSAELIFLMAHYEQSQIPEPLLKHYVGHDVVEFTTIIGVLLRFSLVVGGREATYNMHRLVQLLVKQWLATSGSAAEWQSKALRLLSSHFPSGELETWVVCASLESHAVKMIHTPAIKNDADSSHLATLQINLAWYYFNRGRWSSAEEYARAACVTFQEAHGLRHRDTLAAQTKLTLILKQNTKLEEAEMVIKQTVHRCKALLGSKDRQYFDALDAFALIAQTRGRLTVAEKASRKALSGREELLGPRDPSVFLSQRRLATILEFSGRYEQAETCIMSALNEQKSLVGMADKTTLRLMQRLVFIQRLQGKYVEAEKTAEEYLKVTTATYGPNHIDTQLARYTFAFTLIVNNKIEEAEAIFLSLIDHIEKEHPFGPDHQYNFFVQNALSSIRMIQGRYVEASWLLSTAWNGIQKTYGKHHAKTYEFQSAYAAALTLADTSELDGAMILQKQAYNGLKKVVGEKHPSTLTALLRLSEAYATRRELGPALKMAEQALRGREKMLNANHPDILAGRKRVSELQTMQQGIMEANIELDKTASGTSEKRQRKKRSFFGLRSRASSNAEHVVAGSHADGAITEKEQTAHVATEELEKSESYDSTKGTRKWSLGLFGRYLSGDTEEKIEDKEIDLTIDSDSDDDRTGESLDNEKSAAFTNNPLGPPPLPQRPAVDTQSHATMQDSKEHDPKHRASIEVPSETVQQEDTIESIAQLIRRRRIDSRASRYQEQRKPELKPDASELPAEGVRNPAARLDGPGWDASPFGA